MSRSLRALESDKARYGRVEPPCPYVGRCGGCTLQDLRDEDQVALKRQWLQRAFASLIDPLPSLDLVPMEEPWRYRNKAEFTFGEVDGRTVLGYHVAGSYWRIVPLDDCLLLPQPMTKLLASVVQAAIESGLPPYHQRTHQGVFRHLVVRSSHVTGQLLACLITAPGCASAMEALIQRVVTQHPQLVSFYWGVTERLSDVAVPDEMRLMYGQPYLEETVGPFRIRVHPHSFLQPNTQQADRVYCAIRQMLGHEPIRVLWDLYCGIGMVGFYLANSCKQVYGIDSEPHTLELATLNASLNRVSHVTYRQGRVETLLLDRRFWLQEGRPDVVVVDPPRAGLHEDAINSLLAARPDRIVYLSCHLDSLVRDLKILCASFPRYHLAAVKAFDMFPHTRHLETLVLLER